MDSIRIRGARTHNLKNLNLDLPRHRLIVITGLSGSGKSSLAFDTLYAEGQRRYVESLSAYARQFLQLMEKPDVDLIEGLSPAISIEQKATSHNPRSTVGTVTEIHDYLRLLFARVGDPYCPDHPEQKLAAMTISQMVDATLALAQRARRPRTSRRHAAHDPRAGGRQPQGRAPRALRRAARQGLRARARRRQGVRDRRGAQARQDDQAHDRGRGRPAQGPRGVQAAAGRVVRDRAAPRRRPRDRGRDGQPDDAADREHLFSAKFACPICNYSLQELEPRLFSFNSPLGACPQLRRPGLDQLLRSQARGGVSAALARLGRDPRLGPAQPVLLPAAASLAKHIGFDIDRPFAKLAGARAEPDPRRLRRREDPVHVPVRPRQAAHRASTRSRASCPTSSGATARPIR